MRSLSHEATATSEQPSGSPATPTGLWELRAVLDEEVVGLPERYRAPFVLASMEGLSPSEAAAELGLSTAAVSSRLARVRSLLEQRLARRGVALSAVLCALALGERARAARVPTALSDATLRVVMLHATEGADSVPPRLMALT